MAWAFTGLRCVHTYAALRCKCMLLLNAAHEELRCVPLRWISLLQNMLSCAALLGAA